ncbi:MAG: hypothetical protein HY852_17650 [Bradyrhizobium sp.]|uniref:hypothetical protein n=1 Tax=Bradyrhizobium sp. TaxID=376 RepID=UPI0025C0A0A0|nr:hypothetical protein [Bradyrhizobium sp.]MBI5263637.1 hypothetical protein [Bradyrhizobium sp.]
MREISKSVVKAGLDKTTREFTQRIEKYGFSRTKRWLWVRAKSKSADFVHIHLNGISYGRPINYSIVLRVHCGTYNESSNSLALNGPSSDDSEFMNKRYHLRFNAETGSTYERCMDDLVRFVVEDGEPWFAEAEAANDPGKDIKLENENLSRKALGLKS